MADITISKFTTQVVRTGSTPSSSGFAVNEGQDPTDPSGSGQFHLPVTIGTPANGLAVTEAQVLTIDKAQIFAGTSSQFVKGDGTLDSNTYLTTGSAAATYVPYTGATSDVNLGANSLAAEAGFFDNNGSSDALTVTHTSGSGYGIIVTKGGNNEALYVEKTSGSGNAMRVLGGRTSLVDLALSSVTNTAGDFLTLSGGVVHKRTAAEVRTDIGAGTVTSVGLSSATSGVTIGSTPVTTSGTITIAIATASGSQNGLLSSTDWTTFNNKENAITAGTTAQYFRGDKTFQTLNTAAVPELTNLYYTEARVSANTDVAANTAARHAAVTLGTANGLSLSTQQLSLGLASSSANGALSSTDWTTFNNKQNALTNPVTGTGTTNYLPKFTGSTSIGDSLLFDNGTRVGINTASISNTTLTIYDGTGNGDILKVDTNGSKADIWFNNSTTTNGAVRIRGESNGLKLITGSQERVFIDASGNLGLGVTPSAWGAFKPSLQVGTASISQIANRAYFTANAFFNGTSWTYIDSDFATQYFQQNGTHIWNTITSGTANQPISWTQSMILGSNSGLSIGTGSAAPAQGLLVQGEGRFNTGVLTSGNIEVDTTNNGLVLSKIFVGPKNAIVSDVNGDLLFNSSASGFNNLRFTGAATFSSSVTAGVGSFTGDSSQVLTLHKTSGGGSQLVMSTTFAGGNTYGISPFIAGVSNGGFEVKDITNNATRIAIAASSGNVLINSTSDAGFKLDVNGTGRFSGGGSNGYLYVSGNAGAGGSTNPAYLQGMNFSWNKSNAEGESLLTYTNQGGGSNIRFGIGYWNNSTYSEQLSITSGGNVGIGTASPNYLLHIAAGAANPQLQFTSTGTGSTTSDGFHIGVNNSTLNAFLLQKENADLQILTNDTERMRITSGGNVLIGTATNGASKLRISGLPTSAVGLSSGDVYNLAGVLMIA
jgi:hypothetical protein